MQKKNRENGSFLMRVLFCGGTLFGVPEKPTVSWGGFTKACQVVRYSSNTLPLLPISATSIGRN